MSKVFNAARDLLLEAEGTDQLREGLVETPLRFTKAWAAYTEGYALTAQDVAKGFEDGAQGYDQMICVVDLPFYSLCEHHLAPIFGRAALAYIPNIENPRVLGLSKFKRLLDVFAKRLQTQERLTGQLSNALQNECNLAPVGAAVHIRARHMCMEMRGVSCTGHHTVTKSFKGAMLNNPETRAEFLSAIPEGTQL